jgi:hypothetical protein
MKNKIRPIRKRQLLAVVALVALGAFGAQIAFGASLQRAVEAPSLPAAASANGQTPPESLSEPLANVPSTGPLLSFASVKTIALKEAQRDGDDAPSSVSAAGGTLLSALNVMNPNSAPTIALTAMPVSERAEMEATVYIVEMRGSFTLAAAPVKRGESEPQGTVLRLLLDAHSGQVVGYSLASAAPAPLQNLGPVENLLG